MNLSKFNENNKDSNNQYVIVYKTDTGDDGMEVMCFYEYKFDNNDITQINWAFTDELTILVELSKDE